MVALELIDVHKHFGQHTALDGVSFRVEPGEVFGLLGPNGAGKTTVIRLALDILRADRGEVRLLGTDVRSADHDRVSYLPEERGLYRREKLTNVLSYLAMLKGAPRRAARASADRWLAKLGLESLGDRRVEQLSKGQSQKAQIAAALVSDPDLAILDEPFSGLDPVHVGHVLELIGERRREGKTTILSTHRMNRVEALCDRVVLLNRGRRIRYGTVDEIRGEARDVRASFQGEIPSVDGLISHVTTGSMTRLELASAPSEVLRRLVVAGASLSHWEEIRPGLEEIFVAAVNEGGVGETEAEVTV